MKMRLFTLCFYLMAAHLVAQQEFHVFPKDHSVTPGTETGDGSLNAPWDLQTALRQSTNVVNGGDHIWLHQGVYNGRFVSTIRSDIPNRFVTVSAFRNDKVVINGNVDSDAQQTLAVKGPQVIFKNFEITWLGVFTRNKNDEQFKRNVAAINHLSGKNCRFINLRIHNNPGLGIGSWKSTGGSMIMDCIIYNNGVINEKERGGGEGIYVQNKSEEERIIKDNIIFSNYYKGIEVWSAGRNAKFEYVKNITLDNNVIFNSGLPSNYRTVDNIIVGSDDRNGINIAKNITVTNNILYHNTDYKNNQVNGDAASLTIGFYHKTPVENVIVDNNIILGRNNALRILYAKTLKFTNNLIYSGYVLFNKSVFNYALEGWQIDNNVYYTKKKGAFRVPGDKNYALSQWQSKLSLDLHSEKRHVSTFQLDPVLDLTKSQHVTGRYRAVLYDELGKDVIIDLSDFDIQTGSRYELRDVEQMDVVLRSGVLGDDKQIEIPMTSSQISSTKTLNNFGVYFIDFDSVDPEGPMNPTEDTDNFFKRIWRFLGF